MLWEAKASINANYTTMKTPSSYKIDGEDLDKNSYRSITTGNINRPAILGKKWQKISFGFNYLTEEEAETILEMINNYPLYIRLKSPIFGSNGVLELQGYVSKFSIEMQRNNETGATWGNLTFNFVQGKRVQGQ